MSHSDVLTLAALGGVDSETMHHALERIFAADEIVGKAFLLPKFNLVVWVEATHFHPRYTKGLLDLSFQKIPIGKLPKLEDLPVNIGESLSNYVPGGDCYQFRITRHEFEAMNPAPVQDIAPR